MWMVNPKKLCRQHLLGEHKELHMIVGSLRKGISLQGYYDKKLIDPYNIAQRHNDIVHEMMKRGYNHKSPIDLGGLVLDQIPIDISQNENELCNRCSECKKRIENI
jgi:hypothetical protein